MENGLIVLKNLVPENIFKEGGCRPILEAIVREVGKHIPDVTTAKGRKEIASLAHKIAQSKTFLDNMGKDVKEKYKAIIDPIDKERKTIRDELDALKEIAELALIGAVPEIAKGMKPGRGKNLCDRLARSVHKSLAIMPEIGKEDIDLIQATIGDFGRITGWEGKERQMTTYLSFCADLIERSDTKFDKCILDNLNDLVEYFEIGGNLRVQNCWGGALAADKWFALFEGGKDGI